MSGKSTETPSVQCTVTEIVFELSITQNDSEDRIHDENSTQEIRKVQSARRTNIVRVVNHSLMSVIKLAVK